AEDVAERRTRVGRAVGGHGLLLLGDLERLDGEADALRLLVVGDDAGIDLVALGEALGALVVAVAGEVGATDEGRHLAVGDLHLDAAVIDLGHRAGHHRALAQALARAVGNLAGGELLDAEADALLLDVDV